MAGDELHLLPTGLHEKRLLSVLRNKFNIMGIPTKDAFGLVTSGDRASSAETG